MNRFFRWFGLPGRLVLTILLSLYAIVLAIFMPSIPRYIAVIAMILSTMGDIILMDYQPLTHNLPFRGFIPGSIIFILAHIVYILTFVIKISDAKYSFMNLGIIIALGIFVLLSIVITILAFVRHTNGINLIPATILYLLVICANCAMVYTFALSHGGISYFSAVGVTSFLVSDIIVILEHVCDLDSKATHELIWWFYPIGQILLLLGV